MAATANKPMEIEPLTPNEEKEKRKSKPATRVEDSPDFPEDWKDKAAEIRECITKGFRYYKRRQGDKTYMLLRKGKHDKGLGVWDDEKEAKLFHFYPDLQTMGGIPHPAPWMKDGQSPQGRTFASIPISRPAIIPRDYVPTINVIRYFQMVKENGFPHDFSHFINDIVHHHMHDCHGIELPFVFRKTEEELEEEFYGRKTAERPKEVTS